jgi:hypothetical protein
MTKHKLSGMIGGFRHVIRLGTKYSRYEKRTVRKSSSPPLLTRDVEIFGDTH